MAYRIIRRIRRLVSLREHRRDAVGAEVAVSRGRRDAFQDEVTRAREQTRTEIENMRSRIGGPIEVDAVELGAACARAAENETSERQRELARAEVELKKGLERLRGAHREVKQMELLLETTSREHEHRRGRTEQRELEDLAVVKEVSK